MPFSMANSLLLNEEVGRKRAALMREQRGAQPAYEGGWVARTVKVQQNGTTILIQKVNRALAHQDV